MDSDMGSELRKFRWILGGALIFLVSGFICYGELVYLFRGVETEATVTRVYDTNHPGRYGKEYVKHNVDYTFREPNGTNRTDSVTVSSDWRVPVGSKVLVEYTPGKDGKSRLSGQRNWAGIIIFLISLGALVVAGIMLWVKAGKEMEERKPRRKKRKFQEE